MPSPIITSLIDNDLYKYTMAQAVMFSKFYGVPFDSINVEYEFINRGQTVFPPNFSKRLLEQIEAMASLKLKAEERINLENKCPYLRRSFLDWLSIYSYNPNEVTVNQNGGELEVSIRGPWYRTIFWEVPLMALISELYFQETGQLIDEQWEDRAKAKRDIIERYKLVTSDFGTRRRFSYAVHKSVVGILKSATTFIGTSNLHMAHINDLMPVGTNAHEWYMAHAALFGYPLANRFALESWTNEYDGWLGHALSDTFTTTSFFKSFGVKHAKLYDGLRHDSGDPIEFAKKAINHYNDLRIDPMSKTIIFSDGLTMQLAIDIAEFCEGRIKYAFGIGTHFTNDVGPKPLNIVIKMTKCNGISTVKLSDFVTKATGEPAAIMHCKYALGINS